MNKPAELVKLEAENEALSAINKDIVQRRNEVFSKLSEKLGGKFEAYENGNYNLSIPKDRLSQLLKNKKISSKYDSLLELMNLDIEIGQKFEASYKPEADFTILMSPKDRISNPLIQRMCDHPTNKGEVYFPTNDSEMPYLRVKKEYVISFDKEKLQNAQLINYRFKQENELYEKMIITCNELISLIDDEIKKGNHSKQKPTIADVPNELQKLKEENCRLKEEQGHLESQSAEKMRELAKVLGASVNPFGAVELGNASLSIARTRFKQNPEITARINLIQNLSEQNAEIELAAKHFFNELIRKNITENICLEGNRFMNNQLKSTIEADITLIKICDEVIPLIKAELEKENQNAQPPLEPLEQTKQKE